VTETYTDRHLTYFTIREVRGDIALTVGGGDLTLPSSVLARAHAGASVGVETRGGPAGPIVGWRIRGDWFERRSDQQLAAEAAVTDPFYEGTS
jgi:hypothetical protein